MHIKLFRSEKLASGTIYKIDWDFNNQKLVCSDRIGEGMYLRVFGEDLKEKKRIELPDSRNIQYVPSLWGLNSIALIRNFDKGELWRVNLNTEEWRKIH